MEIEALRRINAARRARQAVLLLTDLAGGPARVVAEGEALEGELGEAAADAFRTSRSRALTVEGRDCFLTAFLPKPRLVMIGAVHISQHLAPMAAGTGFDVEIIDPRTAFATPDRFPGHPPRSEWSEDALAQSPLDPYCALAALTHDPKIDDFAIRAALEAGCFYVGALGSRKTHGKRLERLAAEGVTAEQLGRIRAPIGLDIGAANPAEIAVAVLAEIIAAFRARGREARP